MPIWKWLWPRKDAPRKIRIHLVPDSGDEPLSVEVPLAVLRFLALLIVGGILAILFLIFSSSSLILEKQKNRVLERHLEENTAQLSRMNTLERELEESAVLLYRMQTLFGEGTLPPDSLIPEQILRERALAEGLPQRENLLQRGEQQVLSAMPSTWPLRGWITQEFHGQHGHDYHAGIDIAAEPGTPVRAAGDGVVLVAGWNDEYGNFVLLDHGFGVTSLYGHNSHLGVRKEDRVERGDILGYVGSTGRSTAPHLHFEIRRNGIPEDPKSYLLD
jgi:murein DD-endopeptidase MepM/ murein hydrolase activator NlpD